MNKSGEAGPRAGSREGPLHSKEDEHHFTGNQEQDDIRDSLLKPKPKTTTGFGPGGVCL